MTLDDFIQKNELPVAYRHSANEFYLPFIQWLEEKLVEHTGAAFVLGINGAQGTGKSTLAELIQLVLNEQFSRRSVILSLDDIYLTRDERHQLGDHVHPLLQTRGVPGTHDVALGLSVINTLKTLPKGELCRVPRFDKSCDDRHPDAKWSETSGPVELIIFEGWCIGSTPCSAVELEKPVNTLEANSDADGSWRKYVNEKLENDYATLFDQLDALLFLKAPNFEVIQYWRQDQEHKLKRRSSHDASAVMTDSQVREFIQYYERITRHNLTTMPAQADVTIDLDDGHVAVSMSIDN